MKNFYLKYRHGLIAVLYMVVYMYWFMMIEQRNPANYRIIHVALDDVIPFCEWFVIPYFMWFGYVAATVIFMIFSDKDDFYRCCIFLFTGMTLFLIISTIWPNAHHLRPVIMPRNNILTDMIRQLYRTDTPTNLWPSIHVYNSIGCHLAISHSSKLAKKKYQWIRVASLVLCISIILSTMFIKQHSVFDVTTALVLCMLLYIVVYYNDILSMYRERKAGKKKHKPQWN